MIIVRNVFHLKFGKAKEAKASIKEGIELMQKAGFKDNRACIDATGRFYTLVLELNFDSLSAYEKAHTKLAKNKEWGTWYVAFSQFVDSGYREIYTVVE